MKNKLKIFLLMLLIFSTFFYLQEFVYADDPPQPPPDQPAQSEPVPAEPTLSEQVEVIVTEQPTQTEVPEEPIQSGNSETCSGAGCTTVEVVNQENPSGVGAGASEEQTQYYGNGKVEETPTPPEFEGSITENVYKVGPWSCVPTGCSLASGVTEHKMSLKWDLYDMFNEPLTSKFGVLSGTHIGANLCEARQATYYGEGFMNFRCSRVEQYTLVDCVTVPSSSGSKFSQHCETTLHTRTVYASHSAPDSGCTELALQSGYNTALSVLSGEESYTVDISDPNEAECYGKPDGYKYGKEESQTCRTYRAVAIGGTPTSYAESRSNGNTVIKNYCYELYGSCINVKTGKVEYLTEPVSKEDENPCRNKGEEWYYVRNDYKDESDRHWHIFIPLNTKETDVYQFDMKSKSKENSSKMCRAFIEKYSKNYEYTKYIVPAVGSFNKNKSDINLVKNGCYYKSTVTIPIRQRFYNEVADDNDDTSEIIGFNFYYRPISLDNPFPNGITKYSDWEKWNENKKQGKENPELDKSFNTITYAAANINLSYIRNYNKENLYTDWSKMNIDGSSIFIQKDNIIDRNGLITKKTFYSLGCGIENQCEYLDKEQKIKNPIYQPRCKNNKTNDICPTSSYK